MDELRKIAQEATPGPWTDPDEHGGIWSDDGRFVTDLLYAIADDSRDSEPGERARRDGRFIATFDPVLVGALLDVAEAVKRLRDSHRLNEAGAMVEEIQAATDEMYAALARLDALTGRFATLDRAMEDVERMCHDLLDDSERT